MYWRGRIPVQNVEWKFSGDREQFLSEDLEKEREEIWKNTVQSYPDTYDGKVLTLDDFRFEENSISMNLGYTRFSRVLTLDKVKASPQGYGSLGVQAALFSSDRKYLLLGQRSTEMMYCPLYYGIPGGIFEITDTDSGFESACLREVTEEVEIEINPEVELVALLPELHGTVGVAAIIAGTVSDTANVRKHVSGNEEWVDRKLSWHSVDALQEFVPDNSLEGLILVKHERDRFKETGESIFW